MAAFDPLQPGGELSAPPTGPAGASVDWTKVWPQAPAETKQRLRRLVQTWERLEQNPALVPLDEHLEAACELTRVAHALVGDGPSEVALDLWFAHDGQECNCVYFELWHRVVYVAERFLWAVHRDDHGGPLHTHAGAPNAERRAARTQYIRKLVGLLGHTLARLQRDWRDLPATCHCSIPYLMHLMLAVRAYGLWNAAAQQLQGLRGGIWNQLEPLDVAADLLTEALRTLDKLPPDWTVADGAVPFVRPSPWTRDALKACEEPRLPAPNLLTEAVLGARTWSEALPAALLHTLAQLHATEGELGQAIAAARVLEARGEAVAALGDWERLNRAAQHKPIPKAEALEALLRARAGLPGVLVQGQDPLEHARDRLLVNA